MRKESNIMIIVLKENCTIEQQENLVRAIQSHGLSTNLSKGDQVTIIGIIGDKSVLDMDQLKADPRVDNVIQVTESYKLVNRKFHPEDTEFAVKNTVIGPNNITVMAGPCAIESEEQLMTIARAVKASGATLLRGGAYKPRTSPYSFQGLEEEGLKYMKEAGDETGLATICEVTSLRALETAVSYVDMLQIGARNMQNFELLKEVGKCGKPVMLKRGLAATIDEWLNAAEYIMANGNPDVCLCERGIRTYETATRNTLDLAAVLVLKEKTHLPVIVDPSHATGIRSFVKPLTKSAIAVGADGVMVEVHNRPECALSDGPQSLTCEQFEEMMQEIRPYADLAKRSLA